MDTNRTHADFQAILSDPSFAPHITDIAIFPPREGTFAPLPEDLLPQLAEACVNRGMDRLYSHQAESYASARSGQHTVIVTPTASGKTLCYNL
ncbi:MAG TPA: ATP-dependent helicase, partial [Treponemataceae bacterium]|nr:ATP-dependent helicase [Treponemataceae bacterium]